MAEPTTIFDRDLLRRRKDRAARGPAPDFLLVRASQDLAERLAIVKRSFAIGAVIGALDGTLGRAFAATGRVSGIVSLESSEKLLARCDAPRVRADEEAIPLGEGSIDLAASALSLQLVNDLPGALVQIRRALKPDGLFLAALLGGETLKELREAWLVAESEVADGASPRVAPFADVREAGALLQRAGFALPVADSERLVVTYREPLALMAELKAMGASNMLAARSSRPVTRRLLGRASEVYRERFGRSDGRVPATFEILTLTAWAPHESQQKPLRPGSASHRLADALGTTERKP